MKNVQLVDMPDRLFQQLVSETVRRTTNRVVLDPSQGTLDPGVLVTGQLRKFNYDSSGGQVVVQYDAALSSDGGRQVEIAPLHRDRAVRRDRRNGPASA